MRHAKFALALLAAAALAGCGGGSSGGDQRPEVRYTAQVTFGDSLSDVGTYAVGAIAALGGGKYTINGDGTATDAALTGKNWTELLAAQLGLPPPCAAQTGLTGDPSRGFLVAIKNDPTCFGYAQGGARVTHPIGPNNRLTGSALGQLTVPVVTQIANHLAVAGGSFSGTELVNITAGGNDVAMQLGMLSAAATAAGAAEGARVGAQTFSTVLIGLLAAGATDPVAAAAAIGLALQTEAARPGSTQTTQVAAAVAAAAVQPGNAAVASPAVYGPMVAKATSDATAAGNAAAATAGAAYLAANAPNAVAALAQAGAELVALVKTQVIAKGANYVVVNNLGDFANAPAGKAQLATVNALIVQMVDAFNGALATGLAGESKVLLIDLYAFSHDQIVNPAPYGLSNTKDPACPQTPLGNSALGCTITLLASGDASHFMFADDRHPTPYEYRLIAQYVAERMLIKGWL
ncbi:MAG: SGNH/GDSL hydrolase family protein [Pseudomonadota bacterium]